LDEYKYFVKRFGLIAISNFLVSIIPIILLPVLTKNIPIQDYGIWVQFNITITLVPAVAILGLPYTMVRFMAASKNREELQESFYSIAFIIIAVGLIAVVILFLLSGVVANALFNGNLTVALILPVTIFMTALTLLFIDFFRTFNQMGKYAAFTITQAYITVILVGYFIFSGYGIIGAVTGILIAQTVIAVIMYIFTIPLVGFKIPRFKNIREYLVFGLPTIPSNISFWVLDASDRYVIGIILGIISVSFYSAGYTIGALMSLLTSPLYTVLLPILSRYYAERRIRQTRFLLNYAIKLYLVIAVPFVIILSLLARPLLYILSTPSLANQGYIVTPIVAVGGLFFGLYCIVTQVIVMERKTKITGNIWIISIVLNIVLDVIFGHYFGFIAIALITLLIYLFAFLLTLYYSFQYIRCSFYLGFIAKTIYASIFMSLVLLLLNPQGPVNVVLSGIFSFVFYIFVLWLLKGVRTNEIKFFMGILKDSFADVYNSLRRLG